jgi:excisionase family DNA binding protein
MDSANGRTSPGSPGSGSLQDGIRLPWEWSFESSLPPSIPAPPGTGSMAREPDDDRLLTYSETAELLGVSERSVRRWAADGRIETVALGRLVRVRPSEIRRLVRDGLSAADADPAGSGHPGPP